VHGHNQSRLREEYSPVFFPPDALCEKYGIEDAAADSQILLAQAGKRRGCILPGGAIDYARAQTMILNDFRSGKLGRITLDAVLAEEV
jgi:ribosome biogenesis GTPase A